VSRPARWVEQKSAETRRKKFKPAMKRRSKMVKGSVALLALMAVVPLSRAQYRDWLEQQQSSDWYAVPRLKYIRTDVEAERDVYHSSTGIGNLETTRFYVSPRIGIGWDNYIYHPYLLTYSMLFEPGYVWQQRSLGGVSTPSSQLVLDGTFRANVLQIKPYATTLSYSHSREEAKYGFFNSATVDSQSWGAASGYRDGPVPVEISFQQSHEDSTDFNQNTLTDQTLFNLRAHSERKHDDTTELTYQYSKYDRETKSPSYDFTSENIYQHVSLMDTEHFEQSVLKSSARLNAIESKTSSSTDLNATVNYMVDHTPRLHSYYDYSFSSFAGDNSDFIQNYAVAGLQHQLFDSLSSGLEVHGSQLSSSASGSSFDSQSVGATVSTDYSKRLGGWGHLYLGNSSSYNFTEQQTSGSQFQIDNEAHVVPTNGLVQLTQPRDNALISVTDASFNPLQPADYNLIQSTDPWRIQINTLGPSHIQPGNTILVTYTVQSNPSGSYSVFANQSQIRLTFWHDRVGAYVRYNLTDNQSSSRDFLLQNDVLLQFGADITWRGLSLSGSYTDERSTLYNNRSYNLAESYSRNLSAHSIFGIDLNQQWNTTSSDSGSTATPAQHSSFYNFMVHYDWRPIASLNWSTEVGFQRQQGFGLDQNLFAARTYVNWMVGKLQFHFGYQHENQDFRQESRERDFVFLRARRTF
jgi:hypothetical protein